MTDPIFEKCSSLEAQISLIQANNLEIDIVKNRNKIDGKSDSSISEFVEKEEKYFQEITSQILTDVLFQRIQQQQSLLKCVKGGTESNEEKNLLSEICKKFDLISKNDEILRKKNEKLNESRKQYKDLTLKNYNLMNKNQEAFSDNYLPKDNNNKLKFFEDQVRRVEAEGLFTQNQKLYHILKELIFISGVDWEINPSYKKIVLSDSVDEVIVNNTHLNEKGNENDEEESIQKTKKTTEE